MTAGQKLKQLCIEKSVTAYKLAEVIGISTGGAYKLFERKSIDSVMLIKIAAYLGVEIEMLLPDDELESIKTIINGNVTNQNIMSTVNISENDGSESKNDVTELRKKIEQLESSIAFLEDKLANKEEVIKAKDQTIETLSMFLKK